jgi:hypothetical protein
VISLIYSEDSKSCRLFDPSIQDLIIRRDVQFHEIFAPPDFEETCVSINFLVVKCLVEHVSRDSSLSDEGDIDLVSTYDYSDSPRSSEDANIDLDTSNYLNIIWAYKNT